MLGMESVLRVRLVLFQLIKLGPNCSFVQDSSFQSILTISALVWKIPWTEEPGRLQSMESLRVGHD